MSEQFSRPPAKALPTSVGEMLAGLKVKTVQSLTTHVNDIHVALWGDEEKGERYRQLIEPIWNEQSQEGSLVADDFALAAMIREYAEKIKDGYVVASKLAAIRRSHNVVLRRYGLSRRQRRGDVLGAQDDMFGEREAGAE